MSLKTKVIVSWSSGKDSTLTLIKLLEDPSVEVVGLYTTYVGEEVPYQVTPLSVVKMQAKLVGLPLVLIELPEVFPSNEIYQAAVVEGIKQSGLKVDAVAFGDMFCNGIVEYRQSYIEKAGWRCLFPLLNVPSEQLAAEIIDRGIETCLVTVDTQRLGASFIGERYSHQLISQLPENVDPCGEHGEFHTLVTKAPCFSGQIEVTLTATEQQDRFIHQRYTAVLCD
ncbi:adenine nucleotide alpha hydrolase [Vibrio sp. SCSIO 43136]|uniref:adenine nucleotide alpha hydrolase n=1 Tax=Vibrio sp. SCSIO 43136 TaxID=2819101 RepID=UPI0020750ACF|nr:adenine nucleotide alpha hydrolase [Vibrio sp. SCSIO 43136]USD65410.1 adenine nucleotide alpha hydrolase [Vibrio sp. SCSIO 43136]